MTKGFGLTNIGSPPPQDEFYRVDTFAGGYDLRDSPEDMPQGSSPQMLDVEIAHNDRLIRAPGITVDEAALGHTPTQILLHPGFHFESELLMFAGAYMGVKSRAATTWYNLSLRGNHWAWTNFAGILLLTDGTQGLYLRNPGDITLTLVPNSNVGQAITVFADRVLLGGVIMDDGVLDLMAVAWSAADSDPKNWTGEGAEKQALIGAMKRADRIQGFGSLGFAQLAIICRRSLWIGTQTGDTFQPIDFKPRLEDTGCTHRDTIITTEFGVFFLSEDGIRLFDGNTAEVISDQINPELLPISETAVYSAALDPANKRYYLFAPGATYVLDILRKRWFKWSTALSGGAFFPVQGALSSTWGAAVGTWGAQTLAWWQLLPQESGGSMLFTKAQQLGHEDGAATTAFGVATVPQWFDRRQIGANQESLMEHLATYLTYESAADSTVEVWLPKIGSGDYEAVLSKVLTSSAGLTGKSMFPHLHTGRGVGLGFKILAGFPKIRKASVRYQVISSEIFEGSFGPTYPPPPPPGDRTSSDRVLSFDADGHFLVHSVKAGAPMFSVIVVGGGAGGAEEGGGGGGVVVTTMAAVVGVLVAVHIGLGGVAGQAGGASTCGAITANGGNPPGGGHGGSSGNPTSHTGGASGGSSQGGNSVGVGGGGGGADTVGGDVNVSGQNGIAGDGGKGITTTKGKFGGGGGGGGSTTGTGSGLAGAASEGGGAGTINGAGAAGTDGTGGGGGGGTTGGKGGKGKVIVVFGSDIVATQEV